MFRPKELCFIDCKADKHLKRGRCTNKKELTWIINNAYFCTQSISNT